MSGAEMQAQSQFVAQVRRLVDLAVRVPPVRDSARFAAELRGIADRIESHAGDGPWFHGVRPGDRPALPAGGAGASTAGALWARFNPQAPPIVFSRVDDEVVGTVEVGPAFAGPPGRVHGGVVATLLDHAMGAYLFEIGRSSFTATLNIGYLKATPLGARWRSERATTASRGGRRPCGRPSRSRARWWPVPRGCSSRSRLSGAHF
ncbi:PaaI family thioesterase [Thermocatellispora tengchongensis]|uniref:PaaI family thioesterase n=1 Tax=Thermocatellispora tengchongensis TaxID=1073253 RepID=UPI00363699AA